MLKTYLPYTISTFVLLFLQLVVFNHVDFMGYLNPHIYLLAIVMAPIAIDRGWLLILAFLYGLLCDAIEDTGGIHAIGCLVIAYIRPMLLRSIFGLRFEPKTFKFKNATIVDIGVLTLLMIAIYECITVSLEVFTPVLWQLTLQKILFSILFTFFATTISLFLIKK